MPPRCLSIIIVSYNTRTILRECLRRVNQYRQDLDFETLVVDNASADGSPEMVRNEFPETTLIISKKNLGFAGGNNLGLKAASGRYILLLNSDAYLTPGVLQSTIRFMDETPRCGILGVKLIGEDGAMQPSARMLPTPWLKFLVLSGIAARFTNSKLLGGPDYTWWPHDTPREVGWVPGAYFLIRRELIDTVGFMDERYFLYFEETDYCLQAGRSGWRVMIYPRVSVIHLGGESSKTTHQAMSTKGKQLIRYRLESEFMYYRKNFGVPWVLAAAGVEIFWHVMVIVKNKIRRNPFSFEKIQASRILISEICQTLYKGKMGIPRNVILP
jgi:N-acetylglucosaminyl-diphospho-decaprenol L-rhamnosyltransferase